MPFIKGSIQKLKEEIAKLTEQIRSIQEKCSHPEEALEIKYGSNTGNYDPSSDIYWTDYHCHLCEKTWTIFTDSNGRELVF